jgi:hypothetical protein
MQASRFRLLSKTIAVNLIYFNSCRINGAALTLTCFCVSCHSNLTNCSNYPRRVNSSYNCACCWQLFLIQLEYQTKLEYSNVKESRIDTKLTIVLLQDTKRKWKFGRCWAKSLQHYPSDRYPSINESTLHRRNGTERCTTVYNSGCQHVCLYVCVCLYFLLLEKERH